MTRVVPAEDVLTADPAYAALKEFIIQNTGLAYYADKDEYLAQRIVQRLETARQTDCGEYLELLRAEEAELDRLVEDLTVGETSFFRHQELFAALRARVFPELLSSRRPQQRLRIWSAGCSTGPEPYSLAILLKRTLADLTAGWDISILATDINRSFLARARAGRYRAWDFRGNDPAQLEDCFVKLGDAWEIRPEFRDCVTFRPHNLVRQPFPSLHDNVMGFDLILCRNVLIYFDLVVAARIVAQFNDCLEDRGWLVVGPAEPNVELFRAFETVNEPGAVLYRKPAKPSQAARTSDIPVSAPPARTEAHQQLRLGAESSRPGTRRSRTSGANILRQATAAADGIRPRLTGGAAETGRLRRALQECERIIARDPMNAALYFDMALLAEALGEHGRAEAALRGALYLNASNGPAHYLMGLLQERRRSRAEAERSYRNALRCMADRPDDEVIPGAEPLTIGQLRALAHWGQEDRR